MCLSFAVSAAALPTNNTIVVDNALREVAAADVAADARWGAVGSLNELKRLQAETHTKLLASLGELPPKCALDARVVGRVQRDGYTIEKVMFSSEPNHHVTAHVFLPDAKKFPGRRPGIVIPCGHSLNGKAEASYQRGGLMAAQRGFVAVIYDPVDQGERPQSRKHPDLYPCPAHNEIGRRAELLGWSAARFRVRDGIRALDYLASRPDVDPSRLAVMGHSGGGTMTSWIMALDDRVRCAAPSGFLTTLRDVCNAIGPQDAEQFVFGELAFGFNHLGHILLRAPSPVLMCASEEDFFPIKGVLSTSQIAADVYGRLGCGKDFRLSHVLGPHHWHESTRAFAVDWMDWKLQNGPEPKDLSYYRNRDVGFSEEAVDTGLSYETEGKIKIVREQRWPADVTPQGSTLALAGERTVYDQMRDEAARQKAARGTLTPEIVRQIAGIREFKEIRAELKDGDVLTMDDGTPVPVRVSGAGATVLYIADGGETPDFPGHRIVAADIRGFGATGRIKHQFYEVASGDEELAVLYHLLGKKLVGKRAEDIIAAAKFAGDRPKLVAKGRAAIPAAHAYYTARELFSGLEVVDAPSSWGAYLEYDGLTGRFADIVRGAWAHYDWVDLAPEAVGFVKVEGTRFVDVNGAEYCIRGVNLGNWLLPEGYMFGFSKTTSPNLIDLAFRQLVGDEATARFWRTYKANYITEADIAFVARTGSNTVRLPLNYRLFTSDDYLGETERTEGFARIDDVIGWCRKHGLKLIIDLHACPGGQTGDNIDDSFGYPWLFESAAHRAHYCRLWREIAARYADEPVVLGYDLMNEPISSRLKDCAEINKKLAEVQLEAAETIRAVDRNHIVFFAGGQWNTNFEPFEGKKLGENAAFTCHHYAFGDPKLKPENVLRFVTVRDRANVPMYMGETGHNCTNWYREIVHVMETNHIGWTFWPLKMPEGSCWNAFPYPKGWRETIIPFVETNRASYAEIQAARPDRATAERLLMEYAANCHFTNCTPDRAYLESIGLKSAK